MMGQTNPPPAVTKVSVAANKVLIAVGYSGEVDVVTAIDPTQVFSVYLNLTDKTEGVRVFNNIAYVAKSGGSAKFQVIDVKDPTNPQLINNYSISATRALRFPTLFCKKFHSLARNRGYVGPQKKYSRGFS